MNTSKLATEQVIKERQDFVRKRRQLLQKNNEKLSPTRVARATPRTAP